MNMKKTYTIIVATDHKGSTKKLVISSAWLKSSIFTAVLFLMIGSAGIVDYVGLLFQPVENKRLKAENIQLKNQFAIVKNKMITLEKNLERINVFSTKLRLITGQGEETNTLRLPMGPIPNAGQSVTELNESMEEREPASNLGVRDSQFFKEAPLDTKRDEIYAHSHTNHAMVSVRLDKLKRETEIHEQNLISLWESLGNRQSVLKATPSVRPVNGWFTSKFGYRKSPFTGRLVMHNGIDMAASLGTPIYATADGVVTYSGYDAGYGKLVSVDHGYGVLTRYGHISKLYAKIGQKVKQGDIIGEVGNTGRSTGPHVHYEVRVNGVPVDPLNYILTE